MRNILLLTIVCLSISSFGQKLHHDPSVQPTINIGKQIDRAGKLMAGGYAFSTFGPVIIAGGIYASEDLLVGLGGAMTIAGFIFSLKGYSKLSEAGRLMDQQNQVYLSPGTNYGGLAFNF